MKKYSQIFMAFMLLISINVISADVKKELTTNQILKYGKPRLTKQLPSIIKWLDGSHYLLKKKSKKDKFSKLYSVNAENGIEKLILNYKIFEKNVPKGLYLDYPSSENKSGNLKVYSFKSDIYLLNTITAKIEKLTNTKEKENNPTISPDGKFIAYTLKHNFYVMDISTKKVYQVTYNGSDTILNGYSSWVYNEEIFGRQYRYRAFWWSPDSKKIVVFSFDDSKVPEYHMVTGRGKHGTHKIIHYPKVGDTNPTVSFCILTTSQILNSLNNKTFEFTSTSIGKDIGNYIGAPLFSKDGKKIILQVLNREQNKLYLNEYDGNKKQIIYQEEQKTWIDWKNDIFFIKNNKEFIINSDKNGWNHLYRYDTKGNLINQITTGNWEVKNIVKIDEANKIVYFTAKKEATTRTDLYSIKFNGQQLQKLTKGMFTNRIKISPKGKYFIATYSNLETPKKMGLYNIKGKFIRILGDSKTIDFDKYKLSIPEKITITTDDGFKIPALINFPINFDKTKKYPVVIYTYGGPGSGVVQERWMGLRGQMLAKIGIISVMLDHRGSGHYGKTGMNFMYKNLGKWEINDYTAAVKQLIKLPYINTNKICITGGSYGGYVTLMAMLTSPDYFGYGMADAGVTDWIFYDSHYTERYMGTYETNKEGYDYANVLNHVKNLKGILKITHGDLDDNVHLQNSIQLIEKLQKLDKHFEFMIYPGQGHGVRGPQRKHYTMEQYRFFYNYLLEKPFPKNLF